MSDITTPKPLSDEDRMPYGAYKGQRMIDVPDVYLLWLHENNRASGAVKEYILDNLDAIRSNR